MSVQEVDVTEDRDILRWKNETAAHGKAINVDDVMRELNGAVDDLDAELAGRDLGDRSRSIDVLALESAAEALLATVRKLRAALEAS